MICWVGMLMGRVTLPTAFDPIAWHAHAFLFGYLGAVLSGFVLTAAPNWTGRLPVVGWPLGVLVALWFIGRIAVMISLFLPAVLVAVLDLSSVLLLIGFLLREIIIGRNWHNLVVVAMMGLFALGAGWFHWDAANGNSPAHGIGLRLGLASAVMMISVIGGRIVPSFTRNWLVRKGSDARPSAPMQPFDKIVLLVTACALIAWVTGPISTAAGCLLLVSGGLQFIRLGRWAGLRTTSEPLVWVLHVGYGFVPLGAIYMGAVIFWPQHLDPVSAQHLWMAGAIGMMTMAVMTRATLGHSGRPLTADWRTVVLYLALIGAVFARALGGVWPVAAQALYTTSGVLWCVAFLGFAIVYGPMLLSPKFKG